MAWIYLIFAGLMEIVWALALKQSEQFTQPVPTVIFVITAIASLLLLGISLKHIPVGTAYAVWTWEPESVSLPRRTRSWLSVWQWERKSAGRY